MAIASCRTFSLAAAVTLLLALPLAAQDYDSGADALAARNFDAAELLWRGEAATGSVDAMFQLGLLYDLGLGRPRDAASALRWYLNAAELGLADAQFNAAVMLDSGIGLRRQPDAAAGWYARAALGGNHRAAYNLGLLYAAGDGVARNADIAAAWMSRAAPDIAAAETQMAQLSPPPPGSRSLTAPVPVMAAPFLAEDGRRRLDLVWTATPGPENRLFQVEVIARKDAASFAEVLHSEETTVSALRIALPDAEKDVELAWRAYLVDASSGEYAAMPWQRVGGTGEGPPPRAVLRMQWGRTDPHARALADRLAPALLNGGIWTVTGLVEDRPARTRLWFGAEQDDTLAQDLAAFLPGPTTPERDASAGVTLPPGTLRLVLSGGPAAP